MRRGGVNAVNGVSLDDFQCDFPRKIGQDLSRSLYIQLITADIMGVSWVSLLFQPILEQAIEKAKLQRYLQSDQG